MTFYYDCGILGHDQGICTSKAPVEPNKYGPWLRYYENADISTPNYELDDEYESPENSTAKSSEVYENRDGSSSFEKGKQKICSNPP